MVTSRMIVGKMYEGNVRDWPTMVHRFADEILLALTGEAGAFGTGIAFVQASGNSKEIYVVDFDGSHPVQITSDNSIDLSPSWSTDGRKIAYIVTARTAIIAVALLVPVAVHWASIGRGGRLGGKDVIRAACLGAACAAQQLAWFLVPFLLVGLWSLRRSEMPTRTAMKVVGGFLGIAVAVFAAINLPFLAADPGPWLEAVLSPIIQNAVPHGQGLVGISYHLLDGSGQLAFYSYAALSYGLAVLVLSVLFARRLGPAAFVLPWTIFYLATRSQDGYYLLMTPLWLASLATVTSGTFATAWQPRLAGWAAGASGSRSCPCSCCPRLPVSGSPWPAPRHSGCRSRARP